MADEEPVDAICGYGRYQQILLWLVLLPAHVSCAPQLYSQLLMFLTPDHWCLGDGGVAVRATRIRLCAPVAGNRTTCDRGPEYDRRFLHADETVVTQKAGRGRDPRTWTAANRSAQLKIHKLRVPREELRLVNGVASLAQVYLAVGLAGNAYLHMLLMSSADLSACLAPLMMLKHSGCRKIAILGCISGGVTCFAHFVTSRRGGSAGKPNLGKT
ncbi:hypothetical protein IscW_ISCW018039 [Ixodes scapularis]|uniref:Uncharacterized protein n=1 Tax=Ixodes scapularis TaxID=6945 RepID=B7PEY4_IXOSC|nr:hypothetical protein IscW_ISCW018039 [Ixodes scapularis]|eukprot:XP_002433756.1 hypothetical protein IscW_ISCW018039 [Ixodes scapularis]